MFIKRLFVLAMAILALIFLTAACGGSVNVEPTEPSATQLQPVEPSVTQVQPTEPSATEVQPAEATAEVATKSSTANANRQVGGAVGDLAPEFGGIDA